MEVAVAAAARGTLFVRWRLLATAPRYGRLQYMFAHETNLLHERLGLRWFSLVS